MYHSIMNEDPLFASTCINYWERVGEDHSASTGQRRAAIYHVTEDPAISGGTIGRYWYLLTCIIRHTVTGTLYLTIHFSNR
jgi:hypothetical protein